MAKLQRRKKNQYIPARAAESIGNSVLRFGTVNMLVQLYVRSAAVNVMRKHSRSLPAGMEDWVHHVLRLPGTEPENHASPLCVHVHWAQDVLDEAQKRECGKDDQFLALKARLYALKREPEAALRCAETGVATGNARLRLYIPALVAFAATG